MAPPSVKKKSEKKEKVFHPKSRKAGQLERASLRKSKLGEIASKKVSKKTAQVDRHVFFYHAFPPDVESISLSELHELVRDLWLTRHDKELVKEQASRRPGRPKSTREQIIEELQLQEREEYRTGFVIPDLTDPFTVKLFRKWQGNDPAYLHILQFIRIAGDAPDVAVVARHGSIEAGYPEPPVTSSSETLDFEMGQVQDAQI